MQRVKLTFAIVLCTLILAPLTLSRAQNGEDYKVYDAVVLYMFRDGITRFDMNAKVDQIVIRDRTYSEYVRGPEKENWEQVKIRLRSLSDDTIAGYETARKIEKDLKRELASPIKYLLVSDKRLKEIFRAPYRTSEEWQEFYNLFPNSAGYNSFSRVGFDKDGRNALVYFVNWCGDLCGTGTYVHLEKRETGWVVKEAAGMWIS